MKKIIILVVILIIALELLSFNEPVEVDDDLSGELLVNYQKNVKLVNDKLWILYYDIAIHPLTTYLKLAREQEDGSFDVMTLCNMNIAAGVRSLLDCTFAVQGDEVTIFYKKTYSNIEDVRVFKLHSNNLMNNYQESEFSSLYDKISTMSLELVEDELVLVLLRGEHLASCGMRSLYFENNNGNEFTGQDQFTGPVHSNDDIWIQQVGGWPTFNALVTTHGRIMDASTGQPAINSAPMDDIFMGGYIEESAYIELNAGVAVAIRTNGYILDGSIDRDILYAKIDGSVATCRYADIITEPEAFTVYNSFPDLQHPNVSVGDSIWTNSIDKKILDWDDGTFTINLQSASCFVWCQLWIEGSVSGAMTWGCADTIYVTDDITYASVVPGEEPLTGPDYLGLVSEENIKVKYKNYDPDMEQIQSPNCDGVYIYGILAALGDDSNLGVEYLHPHGSTPAYELEQGSGRELYPYPDFNKYVFSDPQYFSGDEGFIMHSNDMPNGFPCCGYPYESEGYGNGIITPYGTDHPWYNPVYPESSEEIVFERGTIELYGALYERDFHEVLCSGIDLEAHYDNIWSPADGLYGGTHFPSGYELNIHFDERLNYQNSYPPYIHLLGGAVEHQVTILHSYNGGNSFVQRYNQTFDFSLLINSPEIQTAVDDEILAFAYKTIDEYQISSWDTGSNGMTSNTFSDDSFTGDISGLRLIGDEMYFRDDSSIYKLDNDLYQLSDLETGEYYGFSYDYADRLQWTADSQSYDLIFTFYSGDEYWVFDEIGEIVYEQGSEIDVFDLENIYLQVSEQGEAQLFLHGREYYEDLFYLARGVIEALPAEPDEISEIDIKVYPNPFNPETAISFSLSEAKESVSLRIYNIKGQLVKELLETRLDKGNHSIVWKGNSNTGKPVGSGVYFYQLKAGDVIETRKMMLLK
jgi:FlgD Ig-like domain